MAQTTDAITGQATTVSIKVADASYVDISGSTQSIDTPTASKMIGEAFTYSGNSAFFLVGKNESIDITLNVVYTETSGEAFLTAAAAYEAGSAVQLKWVPIAAGNTYETVAGGVISSIVYPAGDASSAGPLMASITVRCGGITRTAP